MGESKSESRKERSRDIQKAIEIENEEDKIYPSKACPQ
jgi:hypothetical protein